MIITERFAACVRFCKVLKVPTLYHSDIAKTGDN